MLRRAWAWGAAGLLLAAALAGGAAWAHEGRKHQGAPQEQVEPTPAKVAQGERLFRRYCAACHAMGGGTAKQGPDLGGLYQRRFTPVLKHPVTDHNIRQHIKKGGVRMPPFPWLSRGELDALVAFLKSR